MALSDEDYGILYNAIDQGTEGTDRNFYGILLSWHYAAPIVPQVETLSALSWQHVKDYACFIVLAEGRELP